MNTEMFWSIIEASQGLSDHTIDSQAKILFEMLLKLKSEDIHEFYRIFMDMLWRSFRADLWDAAQIIACGCSENVFEDFRAWLIGQGRIIFESVINDPETIANLISVDDREEVLNGRLVSAIIDAYEKKAGQELSLLGYDKPLVLIGSFINEEEYPLKYPQLYEKFRC
jgi:hypothetical protein